MGRVVTLAAGLALAAPLAAAAEDCARYQTQLDINMCTMGNWEVSDAELNSVWKRLKPRADAAGWGQALLDEQRAWLKRRDAKCESERDDFAGGSIAPTIYWSCMDDMTRARTAQLRAMF
ncbi:lysozyme inhibitor LprI family protein [Oceaniglobus roseus]|uniref:lysozyme inhibitor LprI family protein n=1 Tax=Oceaniglobus roseus TaxID=1737570 RepID=UPI000C7EBC12|nr:lysozyme inhibitor LprI family protein [Kandeliimicrobium roseum]